MKRLSIIVAVIVVAFAPQSALSNGDCVLNVLIAVAATSETRPSEDDWETELSRNEGGISERHFPPNGPLRRFEGGMAHGAGYDG